MSAYSFFAKSLVVRHNGKPEDLNPKYRDRKNKYAIKMSLFSSGHNANKKIQGTAFCADMKNNSLDFSDALDSEKFLAGGNLGKRIEIEAHVYYVEKEPFELAVLRRLAAGVRDEAAGFLKKLEFTKILTIPNDFLSIFLDVLKDGVERKEYFFEIGRGLIKSITEGTMEISLDCPVEIRRSFQYFEDGKQKREKNVLVVPQGPNGTLTIEVFKEN